MSIVRTLNGGVRSKSLVSSRMSGSPHRHQSPIKNWNNSPADIPDDGGILSVSDSSKMLAAVDEGCNIVKRVTTALKIFMMTSAGMEADKMPRLVAILFDMDGVESRAANIWDGRR